MKTNQERNLDVDRPAETRTTSITRNSRSKEPQTAISIFRCWRLAACITLVVTAVLNAQTIELPITDFVAAQGTTKVFFPPVQDYLGWVQLLCTTGGLNCLTKAPDTGLVCAGNFALVDYAGLADRFITSNGGESSGTVVEGSVLERPLSGNLVEVTVSLHTRNALTFVLATTPPLFPGTDCTVDVSTDFHGPLLLGARADTLPPPPLAERALGESFFHITFTNPAGEKLPDLEILFSTRAADIEEASFLAVASGPMSGGGQGTVTIAQTSNISRSNVQAAVVNLHQTGK